MDGINVKESSAQKSQDAAPKQPYERPVLNVKGTITELTQALGGAGGDAINGSTLG